MIKDIYEVFNSLKEKHPGDSDIFLVENIKGGIHKIGVSNEGLPSFFIFTEESQEKVLDVNLKLIKVAFKKKCQLQTTNGDIIEGTYTIVSLNSASEDFVKYFLSTVGYLIDQLSDDSSFGQIKKELNKLINLFKSLSSPSQKTIQGLWAELLIIDQSSDINYAIRSWHQDKNDRFDFNDGADKIEIKSTTKTEREHRFSLAQLTDIQNINVLIGSVITAETGTGKCVNDLLLSISSRVSDPVLLSKISTTVAETMGKNFESIFDVFFDYQLALNSIMFFKAEDVPKIQSNSVPIEVSNVKFDCKLDENNAINKEDYSSVLIRALI